MARLIALASLAACASPPVVEIGFAAADDSDACLSQESRWFEDLERVWLYAETAAAEPEPVVHACVDAADAGGWAALESNLRDGGDLLADLPVGPPLHLYLLAVKLEPCPGEEGPTRPVDFCAYTTMPVTLREDGDVRADLERYCQGLITTDDCFERAGRRRE